MSVDRPLFGVSSPEAKTIYSPEAFIPNVYTTARQWLTQHPDTQILSEFDPEKIRAWQHNSSNREMGLHEYAAPLELERGILAQIDDIYFGMSLGRGHDGIQRGLRLQFGADLVRTFWPANEISRRLAETRRLMEAGLSLADNPIPPNPDPLPKNLIDLANLVEERSGRYYGALSYGQEYGMRVAYGLGDSLRADREFVSKLYNKNQFTDADIESGLLMVRRLIHRASSDFKV